jgi:ribosome-associated protein
VSAPRSESLARRLAEFADSKKAEEIVALDMRELVSYTDFLVICTARTGADAGWAVLDYLDCFLHVFTEEARQRFQLEDLWREAPRLELDLDAPEEPSAASA